MYFNDALALEEQRSALLLPLSGERAHLLQAREARAEALMRVVGF